MFNTNIKSVIDLISTFSTQEKCIKYLEQIRWDNEPVSPFDETSTVKLDMNFTEQFESSIDSENFGDQHFIEAKKPTLTQIGKLIVEIGLPK